MFELLDHTADAAVRLRSRDEVELFRDATRALLGLILDAEMSRPVEPRTELGVRLQAENPEALLVDYLNELIFLFDTRRFLACDLTVEELSLFRPEAVLAARVRGEELDPARHHARTEVKAATFHGMAIERQGTDLTVDVIFDL